MSSQPSSRKLLLSTTSFGVWTNLRGKPCVQYCIRPIGRHDASGLSLLLRATCLASRSFAYGVSGSPPGNDAWTSRKFVEGGVPGGGGGGGGAPRRPAAGLKPRQVPEKSGLPSAVRGAGALRSGLPSGSVGVGRTR